jgi:hypothetical protein
MAVAAVGAAAAAVAVAPAASVSAKKHSISHVLLISVDGLHASDLATWVQQHPNSTLAQLSQAGTTYDKASTSKPSDSFPGLLAEVTGGTPKTTGVFYDDSYDRNLSAPGSNCSVKGAEMVYDESIDTGATTSTRTILGESIDPSQLPVDPANGCTPVYPNNFLRTNTIFSVASAAGLRTAWSDKHPAYQIVNGNGTPNAVDDLFTPEINADIVPNSLVDTRGKTITFPFPSSTGFIITDYVGNTEAYDQIKVDAILNEIDGLPSTGGATNVGTPAIYGMNFQSVSVGEKDVDPTLCNRGTGVCTPGYVPGGYEPGTLAFTPQMSGSTHYTTTPTYPSGVDVPGALDYVDSALGQMVHELDVTHQLDSTRIIISAKHGQSPIDPAQLSKIGHAVKTVLGNASIPIAQITDDDIALVWLADQSQTAAAVQALTTDPGKSTAHVQTVFSGPVLANEFGDPLSNSRTPDLIVQPTQGTIYSHSGAKVAEHGGFADPDTHVALLVTDGGDVGGNGKGRTIGASVQTTQIAPTILSTLGLNPSALDAVRAENTKTLPGLGAGNG